MGKAVKGAKVKKAPPVKDLTAKDANTVKGGKHIGQVKF